MLNVEVLRLFHRRERDKRVTTHCALVSRAFGANSMYYSGDEDPKIEKSISKIVANWGGKFFVQHVEDYRDFILDWAAKGGVSVHLTMYGLNLPDVHDKLRQYMVRHPLLVVVGASKVPLQVYRLVDFNVAIGHQPHSEIAALAILLDRLFGGIELRAEYNDARLRVEPLERSKKLLRRQF
jgi:tRNA (cytidine56-2'-O)-methyltransferase